MEFNMYPNLHIACNKYLLSSIVFLATTSHKGRPLSLCILGGHLWEVRLYVAFFVCGFLVFVLSSLFLSLQF